MDGELVFIGDAGNAEAGRPSKRHGVEWANHWRARLGGVGGRVGAALRPVVGRAATSARTR
jgi:hypothetical protein